MPQTGVHRGWCVELALVACETAMQRFATLLAGAGVHAHAHDVVVHDHRTTLILRLPGISTVTGDDALLVIEQMVNFAEETLLPEGGIVAESGVDGTRRGGLGTG